MNVQELINNLDWLRNDIIGRNMMFETPFGQRPLVYADYTASGRGLYSIENYIQRILQFYANTHTEDDFTGKTMTGLLKEAEKIIKAAVHAGEKGKIIFTESGTTGGIAKLQQILGVYWPPATRERVNGFLKSCLVSHSERESCNLALRQFINDNKPLVLVSPYEHHSNEIMWRQTLCDIIEIPLADDDELDLVKLEEVVSNPKYANRPKIGSFSAASNVSGLLTRVYEVARILHKHKAIACFDFAACAPYIDIDMNKDAESYFDAIFLSPHKFLGGPGSSGVLIINEDIYPKDLPPTVSAGGTVDYVSPFREEFMKDIEAREKAGTPGILQAIRAALSFQIKDKADTEAIFEIESYHYKRFMSSFLDMDGIAFYGPLDSEKKIPIIPFNVKHNDKVLHPKFVTKLLNDLFGIQTRAGCSCAGPYGHHLMKIEHRLSDFYRLKITNEGYTGIKPGWVRLNLHYILDEAEVDYLIAALKFVVEHGYKFLPMYIFDIKSGEWHHEQECSKLPIRINIEQVFDGLPLPTGNTQDMTKQYQEALEKAYLIAKSFSSQFPYFKFEKEIEDLLYFHANQVRNYQVVAEIRL